MFWKKASILTKIPCKEIDGYLRAHPRILSSGDVQSMVFTALDQDPFWISTKENGDKKLDLVFQENSEA
jgi:hypothetical protein